MKGKRVVSRLHGEDLLLLNNLEPTIDANLQSGFRKCGIYPLDKDSVLGMIRRSQPKNDSDVRDTVLVAVLDRLSYIKHYKQLQRV